MTWEREREDLIRFIENFVSSISFLNAKKIYLLKDVSTIKKGKQINKVLLSPIRTDTYCYPVMNGGKNPSGYWHNFNAENVISICEGGNVGYLRMMNEKYWSGGHNYAVSVENTQNWVNIEYLYFCLKQNETKLKRLANGVGIKNLNFSDLQNFVVHLPNKNIQDEIASKLIRFENLTNGITEGIPLLIEKVEQQYEYYRDLLFKKIE
ncbi:restriction endonuclease subunit S [Mycoplasma sp. 4044]